MSEQRPEPTPFPAPDPAHARLRAADPAARLEPDLDTLRAAVRARLDADAPSARSRGRDQLAAVRGARGPRRWAAVAAVAAGTLVVGSAGYALGDRSGADVPVPTAASLPGPAGAPLDPTASGESLPGAEARIAGPESADAGILPWYGGRTVFRAVGLSGEPGVGEAWAYDPAQVFSKETASLVASSLGLTDEPRLEGTTWTVGTLGGAGPHLQLQPDGMASVSYYDPTLDPFGCAEPRPEPDMPVDGGGDPGEVMPAPADCGVVGGAAALEGDAAVARAREVVAGAGADPAAFEYEVQDTGVPSAAYVTAYRSIGGQRTGDVWSMTLVGDAVQSLYGGLAPLVPLGPYDVVSETEAVSRLTDPRFGIAAGGPVMAVDGGGVEPAVEPDIAATAPGGGPAGDGAPPAAVQPGSTIPWPVTEVQLTSARLGLAQHTQPDGSTVVLPAYELSDDDGATWSVIAVAESGLDLTPTR